MRPSCPLDGSRSRTNILSPTPPICHLSTPASNFYIPLPAHLLSPALTSSISLPLLFTLGGGVICGVESIGPAPGNCVKEIPSAAGTGGANGSGAVSPVGNPTDTEITVAVPFTKMVVAVFVLEAREQ